MAFPAIWGHFGVNMKSSNSALVRPLTSEQLLWYKESRQICGFIQRQVLAAFSFYADFLAQNP